MERCYRIELENYYCYYLLDIEDDKIVELVEVEMLSMDLQKIKPESSEKKTTTIVCKCLLDGCHFDCALLLLFTGGVGGGTGVGFAFC